MGEPRKYYRDVVLRYDGDECLFWPFGTTTHGYPLMRVDGRNEVVSRQLCRDRNGPPPTDTHEAAHTCGKGNMGCVAGRHLIWKTPTENQADRVAHGTHVRGAQHPRVKLTEADVSEIRSLRGALSQYKIAKRFGVSRSIICDILSGRRWASLKEKEETTRDENAVDQKPASAGGTENHARD